MVPPVGIGSTSATTTIDSPPQSSLGRGECAELSAQASIKSDKRKRSPEVSISNTEQPKEEAARKGAPEGVPAKTAVTLRNGRAQVDAAMVNRPDRLAEETKASPWGSQTSTNTQSNVKEQGIQPFIFKSNKYSEEEQRNMIRHCKQKFEYSVTLRQPTTMQWDIMLAIVEGELLIRCLLHFLRRVCDGDTLFRFQNTIAAQVKGELVGKLADAMQVYKDHQSTGRIVEAIFQAARFRNDGKMELRDEMGHNDDTLPTPIGAAHIRAPDGDNRRAIGVKQRVEQAIGSGRAADRRIEIHVQNQHLNIARSMNMALLLEYLKQTTGKRFYAYPLDDEIVSNLPRKPATFTSAAEIKESVSDGIDKKTQPLQPAAEDRHASGKTSRARTRIP
ncbi:hypothetical protein FI667_g11182, partial [Globisporangium splendens]